MRPSELANESVLVLGLGVSGRSAALFCAQQGARVVAADERARDLLGDLSDLEGAGAHGGSIELIAGRPFPDAREFDRVVPSPGVPAERYRASARAIWGDIELAWRALEIPVIAVTGSNGKSTTVSLIEAMLGAAGLRARAAGNVGTPALSLLGQGLDVAVFEVSSFQLETVETFQPRVAVVLNVTPDHLDRHGDFEAYAEAKRRILLQQEPDDVAVLCFDDPVVKAFATGARGEVIPISLQGPPQHASSTRCAWVDSGAVVLRDERGDRRIGLESSRLLGRHNLENVLAALTAVWAFGADPTRAIGALIDFEGLPHRSELVAVIDGVRFVNDSKATNPGAAQRAIEGAGGPIVWIAGGRDKGLSYAELCAVAPGRVKHALLIGEAAPLIESTLAARVPCLRVKDLDTAVEQAVQLTQPGDTVLLAPACSSFDQFASFEERGECFRRAVLRLPETLSKEPRR